MLVIFKVVAFSFCFMFTEKLKSPQICGDLSETNNKKIWVAIKCLKNCKTSTVTHNQWPSWETVSITGSRKCD